MYFNYRSCIGYFSGLLGKVSLYFQTYVTINKFMLNPSQIHRRRKSPNNSHLHSLLQPNRLYLSLNLTITGHVPLVLRVCPRSHRANHRTLLQSEIRLYLTRGESSQVSNMLTKYRTVLELR